MKYAFKDIAFNSTEKRIPAEEDRLSYIGLEHLDSRKLAVTRFGSDVPLKGEKLVMKKGDILFGKRNTYLKRVAIAPHDGLFSAHGMVLRPNEQVISKEFFPFFLSSDYFLDEAIRISVGSLSPTVNWKDLRDLEFEVPCFDEQHKLAQLLSAANDLKESYERMIAATDEMVKSQFIEMFGTIKSPSACDVMTVGDAVERGIIEKPMDGNHGSKHPTADEYVDSGIPFLLANNITEEGVDLLNCSFITKERALRLDKGFAHNGDVLLTHKGTVGRVAVLNCPNYDFVMLTPQVTYYRPLKGLSAEYLKAYFESQGFQEEIMSIASSGATRAYIGITEQRKLHLLIPNTESQCSFVTIVKLADKSKYLN